MNMRIAAGVALALVAPLAGSAEAKSKPAPAVCNLVKDDKADEKPVSDANLDILSADLASDSKRITATIRTNGSVSDLDPAAPNGRYYTITFYGQGADNLVFFNYVVSPSASAAVWGNYDPATNVNTGEGDATFKASGGTITMTTTIGNFSQYGGKFKPGAKISQIEVTSGRMAGAFVNSSVYGYAPEVADDAAAPKVYVAGQRSCVKVGG
jgi:hypothetical protein